MAQDFEGHTLAAMNAWAGGHCRPIVAYGQKADVDGVSTPLTDLDDGCRLVLVRFRNRAKPNW